MQWAHAPRAPFTGEGMAIEPCREMVIQILGDTDAMKSGTATRHQSSSQNIGMTTTRE